MKAVRFIACLLALAAAACSNDSTTTTSPTSTTPSTTTSLYTGTLQMGGTMTSPAFTVAAAGTATLGLVSVTATPTGPALPNVQVGIGVTAAVTNTDNSVTCGAITNSTTATASFVAQLSAPVALGPFCVTAFDPGTLTAPVTFVIRVVHP